VGNVVQTSFTVCGKESW